MCSCIVVLKIGLTQNYYSTTYFCKKIFGPKIVGQFLFQCSMYLDSNPQKWDFWWFWEMLHCRLSVVQVWKFNFEISDLHPKPNLLEQPINWFGHFIMSPQNMLVKQANRSENRIARW